MSPKRTLATATRVLKQLSHDHRTLALIFVVPSALMIILKYVFESQPQTFEYIAPLTLGIFPLVMMFLITSIATLRERRGGTLERLMTTKLSKLDFILGYGLAFSAVALLQAVLVSAVVLGLLQVTVLGGTLPLLVTAVLAAFLGTTMGLFTSAFATSEFQAVQFMPAFIMPQLLVCGLFIARDQMAAFLQWFSDVMPLTYSVDAMMQVSKYSYWTGQLTKDLVIVALFAVAALILGAATIRRQH
jgi:ABC-2 type transport system permease protein